MACWKINQYIGHLFKMHPTYIAIKWTPIGNRKGQKPKDTWRRSGQEERRTTGHGDRSRDGQYWPVNSHSMTFTMLK